MTFTAISDTLSDTFFTIVLLTAISDTLIDFEIHASFTFTATSDTFFTIILLTAISDTLIDFEIHAFVSEGLSAEMTRHSTW
jgi:hypothetical protein